jgi:hypothetical protein
MQLKTINKILIVILIIVITTLIRLYPIFQFSFQPSGYNGLIQLRTLSLIETGHTPFSMRGEILIDIYNAVSTIIINLDPAQNLFLTTVIQCAGFSLIVLLFTKVMSKDKKLDIIPIALIVLFSIFATPDIITRLTGWNGPYLWIFYFLALYLIIFKKQNRSIICISMILLFILPIAYFTEALFVFLILIVLLVYQNLVKRILIPNIFIIIYIIFFMIYETYVSNYTLNWVYQFIDMIVVNFQNDTRSQILEYIASGTEISMIKNFMCILFASIPLVYFIFIGKKKVDTKIVDLFYVFILTISILIILFYLWMGITGIFQRIPIYITLISILAFAVLSTSNTNKKHYKILISIVMISVIFSGYTYITSDYNSSTISFDEAACSNWLENHAYKNETIFTDLRLSGPITYDGYSPVIINDATIPPDTVNQLLEKMFYNIDSPMEAFGQLNNIYNVNIKIAFFSTSYTERFPGIKGYDYSFLPAPKNYLQTYDRLNQFDVIYRNRESTLLYVNGK